jgi:hypothetical protein
MYVKPPSANSQRVKLPDNYGGNAFSRTPYGDMPPPIRQTPRPQDTPQAPEHIRQDIPKKSSPYAEELWEAANHPQDFIPNDTDASNQEYENTPQSDPPPRPEHAPSLLSALLPKGPQKAGFPFTHGIGGEELLILGIILLLSQSDEGSDLLPILVILLFFKGEK